MIRPVTCVCMLLAGASGLALYQAKHRAHLLDREIMRTIRATAQTDERVAVLRAEWALLNEPERLAELSHQHLGLRTLSPQQFVPASEIAARLPAPLPPDAVAASVEDDADEFTPALAAAPAPLPPRPPVQLARPAQPAPPAPVHVAGTRSAPQRPTAERAPAERQVAERPTAERPAVPAPQPPRVLAPVVSAYAVPMAAPPPRGAPMIQRVSLPAPAAYAPHMAPAAYEGRPAAQPPAGPSLGSALGGSRTALAPPVPYAPSSFPR